MGTQQLDACTDETCATNRVYSEPAGSAFPYRAALAVLSGVLAMDIGGLNVVNAALPGIGREFGEYGFEAFLEPKTVSVG